MAELACRRMTRESRGDAFRLLAEFLRADEHYLASSAAYGDGGEEALGRALELFLARPETGFVWLAYLGDEPVAVCVVCLAISTSAGALVAKLDDVAVKEGRRGRGIGAAHLAQLKEELRRLGVRRIDTAVHLRNEGARRFYARQGFRALSEERVALLL
jgi:GNAT superfamily N-acetyltransferase